MLKIKEAVIVEGKYDKIKLQSVIDAFIIVTDGFGIYKDKEKMELIRLFAKKDGIIILTDSDNAGFQIRNYIKSCVNDGRIINLYIPDIFGKEKRKAKPSAENKLGVEGIDVDILRNEFQKAGILTSDEKKEIIFTKSLLMEHGLIGAAGANELRKKLAHTLSLPENLSTNSLIEVLNAHYTYDEYINALKESTNGIF